MLFKVGETSVSLEAMRRLAELRALAPGAPSAGPACWLPVKHLIASGTDFAKAQEACLADLILRSNAHLKPLTDPLATDFGTHRWLRGEREEAYSSWLAWILALAWTIVS